MQLREIEVDVRLRLLVGDDDAEDEIAFIDRLMEALRSDDASRAIARASCHLLGVEPVWQGLIGVREVARRLGVHENTVRNWARPGGVLHAARAGDGPPLRFRAADILP